jgi:hypothetical protein
MPRSVRFRELANRLAELRRNLLPKAFSPTGMYNARQTDRARGYRLLAHAEIESYLEDRAREVARVAVAKWQTSRKAERVVVALVAFHHSQEPLTRIRLKELHSKNRNHAEEAIHKANQRFHRQLANNHGIKEENVLEVLLPLGMDPSDIDTVWLSTMDSFASLRGETAHTSIRTHQPLDPKTEKGTVDQILLGLRDIDKKLSDLTP